MKKKIYRYLSGVLCIAIILCFVSPKPTNAATSTIGYYAAITSTCSVFASPTGTTVSKFQLEPGTIVTYTKSINGYSYISCYLGSGYVYTQYIKPAINKPINSDYFYDQHESDFYPEDGKQACCVTSIATMLSIHLQKEIRPISLPSYKGIFSGDSRVVPQKFNTSNAQISAIMQEIKNNRPVVMHLESNVSEHWVCVIGATKENPGFYDLIIINPSDGVLSRMPSKYYFDEGSIYKIK